MAQATAYVLLKHNQDVCAADFTRQHTFQPFLQVSNSPLLLEVNNTSLAFS